MVSLRAPRLFGTNGIRGVVGKDIDARFAHKVGLASGALFKRGMVLVGRDGRASSLMLSEGVIAGLLAQACDVEDYGLVTTPALQFSVKYSGAAGGVVITASHNPPEYNGFKVIDRDGVEIPRRKEERIEELVYHNRWRVGPNPGERTNSVGALERYFSSLKTHVAEESREFGRLKVVVDTGNGVSALTTPVLLKQLGCEVLTINDNIDGRFPGRPSEPKPETLSTLAEMVRDQEGDVGIAHDGDGDRAIFTDEGGEVHWGDRTFALIEDEVMSGRPGAKVVTPLNSSMAIQEIARKRRGKVVFTKVGSIFVSRTMLATHAVLGGEENGGIFYAPHHPVRDGTMAALLVLKAIVKRKMPLSKLLTRLPRFAMAKEKFQCKTEASKKRAMSRLNSRLGRRVNSRLDGLKVDVKGRGWVLIRPSGTEPLVRLYAEGRTERDLALLLDEFKPMVKTALKR